MSKLNTKTAKAKTYTHEGAIASRINAEQQLRRLVMAHLLWEDGFYVNGRTAADQVADAVANLSAEKVRDIAIEARSAMKLRHIPLLLARAMAGLKSHRHVVADTLAAIIQRPDELTEYIALYWKDGKKPLSAQSKKGLARAFRKFNEYSLAKYNRDGAVRLRDALFLCHAKPVDEQQKELWKRLAQNELSTPDTWEVAISATKGENKKGEWERLLKEEKLGALAVLRNLRNCREAGVSKDLIGSALRKLSVARVLPFRFIAAANHNPQLEPEIEEAMLRATGALPKLPGKTAIVVDNSGSMYGTKISAKSELDRIDAACALAILTREMCEQAIVIGFGNEAQIIPARRGFALRDAIKAGPGGGTNTRYALDMANREGYDRIIVITDEQSHQQITPPASGTRGYFMNVANYQNGIGYGAWVHLDGFSEALLQYIAAHEGIGFNHGTQTEPDDRQD